MARHGGTRNIKELRAQYEAAERRKKDAQGAGEEQAEELEEDDEVAAEAEAGDEAEAAPKKKKKPAAKEAKPKRTRTPKVVRQRVVWVVYNNSNAKVQTFPYAQRKEAEEYAAKMSADKGSTFFVNPLKEPIEEKKE